MRCTFRCTHLCTLACGEAQKDAAGAREFLELDVRRRGVIFQPISQYVVDVGGSVRDERRVSGTGRLLAAGIEDGQQESEVAVEPGQPQATQGGRRGNVAWFEDRRDALADRDDVDRQPTKGVLLPHGSERVSSHGCPHVSSFDSRCGRALADRLRNPHLGR